MNPLRKASTGSASTGLKIKDEPLSETMKGKIPPASKDARINKMIDSLVDKLFEVLNKEFNENKFNPPSKNTKLIKILYQSADGKEKEIWELKKSFVEYYQNIDIDKEIADLPTNAKNFYPAISSIVFKYMNAVQDWFHAKPSASLFDPILIAEHIDTLDKSKIIKQFIIEEIKSTLNNKKE